MLLELLFMMLFDIFHQTMKSFALHEINNSVPMWLFDDPLALSLLKFISVPPKSSKNREIYSSAFVTTEGKILSIARNMQILKNEGWKIRQGYANHAEMMAYCVADLVTPGNIQGYIYVIGFISENEIFIHKKKTIGDDIKSERFTCTLCAKKVCEHQINGIAIPTAMGWKKLEAKNALATAQSFHNEVENGNNNSRKNESLNFSNESVIKLVNHLKKTNPKKLIQLLEKNFELNQTVVKIIKAANDGYVSTKNYKKIVLK